MPMYNLIEYGDNYSDTSGSLWQFKRDEIEGNVDLTANNSSSFKCKLNFSFIKLKWYENCILSNLVGNSTFTITDAKLYVPIVTLYQQKTMQNYQNYWQKDLKDQFIGTNIK